MKLYLQQHGDALPEEINHDRPLSERGREDVKLLAKFAGRCGIRVQRVYHSGKTRARECPFLLLLVSQSIKQTWNNGFRVTFSLSGIVTPTPFIFGASPAGVRPQ